MFTLCIIGLFVSYNVGIDPFAGVGGITALCVYFKAPLGLMLSTYVPISVLKGSVINQAGANKSDKITIIDADEILTWPTRDIASALYDGNFVMQPGKYMVQLYMTASSIKVGYDTEGDPDRKGFVHTIEGEHPGKSREIRAFLQYFTNKNLIIIYEECSTGKMTVLGTKCAPMQLVPKGEDDKDKTLNTLVFKSIVKAPVLMGDYEGTYTLPSVMGIVSADATTVNVAAGQGEYQLTSGSASAAAITALTNPVNGGFYTLLGTGGEYPSEITSAGNFILALGNAWTAENGSRVTLKAYKDGNSSWKFIELSRT